MTKRESSLIFLTAVILFLVFFGRARSVQAGTCSQSAAYYSCNTCSAWDGTCCLSQYTELTTAPHDSFSMCDGGSYGCSFAYFEYNYTRNICDLSQCASESRVLRLYESDECSRLAEDSCILNADCALPEITDVPQSTPTAVPSPVYCGSGSCGSWSVCDAVCNQAGVRRRSCSNDCSDWGETQLCAGPVCPTSSITVAPTAAPTPTAPPPPAESAGWISIEDPFVTGSKTSGTVYARGDISVIDTPLGKYVVNGKALVLPQEVSSGDSAFGKDGTEDIYYHAHDPARSANSEWTARGYMSTVSLNSGLSYEGLKKLVKNLDTTKTSINDSALYAGGGFEIVASGDKELDLGGGQVTGRTIIFIESGDLKIKSRIETKKDAALIFVVQGKIIIDPDVKRVDAMLISFSIGEAISTGTKGQGQDNGNELTISGGALAINGGLKLERSLPVNQIKNKPSETFAFEPKYLIFFPEFVGESRYTWEETAP